MTWRAGSVDLGALTDDRMPATRHPPAPRAEIAKLHLDSTECARLIMTETDIVRVPTAGIPRSLWACHARCAIGPAMDPARPNLCVRAPRLADRPEAWGASRSSRRCPCRAAVSLMPMQQRWWPESMRSWGVHPWPSGAMALAATTLGRLAAAMSRIARARWSDRSRDRRPGRAIRLRAVEL